MPGIMKKRETTLFILIVILILTVTMRSPNFFSLANFRDILDDTSILIMIAIGQFLVILTGGIDLSVASGIAFSGMSVALINQHYPGIPILVILFISLAAGFLLGSLNGVLVSILHIPPIIVTLGTMSVYRGCVFVLSSGETVNAHEMTTGFQEFPHGQLLGLSTLIIFAIITAVLFAVFLKKIKTGREIYAVGDNELAATYVGINVRKIKYIVFMLSGMICGLCGFLWVARYASAQNETAAGFELQAIAACVIGGVSIMGGIGNISGVILGALFMGILNNALTQGNISPFWQMAIQGLIILIAIITNTIMDTRNERLLETVHL